MTNSAHDRWLAGDAYEAYMGRWSRRLADAFVDWVRAAPAAHWLEIGCGTGALTSAICRLGQPASVVACDPSASFVDHARRHASDGRASFVVGGIEDLPIRGDGFDLAVSGLVLNFLPDADEAVARLRECLRPGGTVAAYVWDYADGVEFLRAFWDEAVALDPRTAALHEGTRFPLCEAPALASLFRRGGLEQVETGALEMNTTFDTFDDYWGPFLRGTGPAPGYVASLDEAGRERLRERLAARLPAGPDGRISLRARAWAVRGRSR